MGLSAPVTNIPISVRFNAIDHKDMLDSSTQVQANGSDIRVTKADGTTDVPFEIEHLSVGDSTGALHLWILADNVAVNDPGAASYRVYWGKTGQTSMSSSTATFPTSAGFQAVFHLNDTGATIANAANPALSGTATGTDTTSGQSAAQGYVSAKSGSLVRGFGGSTGGEDNSTPAANYIKFSPAGSALNNYSGPLTIEGWVYSSISSNGNTSPGTKHIVAQGSGAAGGKAWFARTAGLDGTSAQNHYSAGGPNTVQGPIAPFGEQHHWQFVSAVWDGTNWTIYRNRENDFWNNPTVAGPSGMTPDSATYKTFASTAPVASTSPWYVGGASTDAGDSAVMGGWQGWMDEVRVSTVARDSNYVKLTFLTSRADTLAGVIHPVTIGETQEPITGPYANWTGHRSIVLNTTPSGANVTGEVRNFPVLIRLGAAEASIISAANGGNSIRFSKADDATPLPYEIESWSSTAAAIWVKVDTIKGNNATQSIRMHWGNSAAASESDGAAVFDTANGFRAVWHLNETASPALDATPLGTDAVWMNTPTGATGNIGGGVNIANPEGTSSANGKYLRAAYNTTNDNFKTNKTDGLTLSAWVNRNSDNGQANQGIAGRWNWNGGDRRQSILEANSTSWQFAVSPTGLGSNEVTVGDMPVVNGNWVHVLATYRDGAQTLYVNGVADTTLTMQVTGLDSTWANAPFLIGRMETNNCCLQAIDARIDEVRLSDTTRSPAWIKLEYENQKAVNTLANIGLPVVTVPGKPTGVTATADTISAVIAWTAPADNGGSPVTSYLATVVGDTLLACTSTTLTCKIEGLALATSYNVVVRAINAVGRGPNSDASNAVTPISPVVPGAPTGVTATTVSSSAVNVSWTAPTATGGAPITGYTVTAAPGGAQCFASTELTCQVIGLTQGTEYSFTVTATNLAGSSVASAAAEATTTGLLPGAFVIAMDGARNPYTYRVPAASVASIDKLTMSITDVQGKRIWTRTINPAASKASEITWNGVTSTGRAVAPGLYVVKISAQIGGNTIESINKAIRK